MTPADLRACRLRIGWTQAEMARQLGMHVKAYAGIESGNRAPAPESSRWRELYLACYALEHWPETRLAA